MADLPRSQRTPTKMTETKRGRSGRKQTGPESKNSGDGSSLETNPYSLAAHLDAAPETATFSLVYDKWAGGAVKAGEVWGIPDCRVELDGQACPRCEADFGGILNG